MTVDLSILIATCCAAILVCLCAQAINKGDREKESLELAQHAREDPSGFGKEMRAALARVAAKRAAA